MDSPVPRRLLIYIPSAATVVLAIFYLLRPISDPDFFWHLKTGEWIVQHRAVPTEDPFSYTVTGTAPQREKSVLASYVISQIVFYLSYVVGGMGGIVVLRFIIVALLMYVMMKRRKGDGAIYAGLLLIFIILLTTTYFIERPQLFSFIFFAVLLYLLERIRAGDRAADRWAVWLVPVTMLLWANAHAGFVLGQATLVLYVVFEGLKFASKSLGPLGKKTYIRLVLAASCGIALSFANANTYHAWSEMVFQPKLSVMDNVEYQSTITAFSVFGQKSILFYWMLLGLAPIALILQKKKFDLTEAALVVGTGLFSFWATRYIAAFAIAALPVIGRGLSGDKTKKIVLFPVILAALTGSFYFAFPERFNYRNVGSDSWIHPSYPEKAGRFIVENNLSGNMYNHYNWGGYLIWRLSPERRVFVDGRCLDHRVVKKSVIVESAYSREVGGMPAWKYILKSYDVKYVLIPLSQPDGTLLPLLGALLNDRDWVPVFLDSNSVVMVDRSESNREVAWEYAIPKEYMIPAMLQLCNEMIRTEQGNIFLHITRGDLLMLASRNNEARQAYREALVLDPFNITARERLEQLNRK